METGVPSIYDYPYLLRAGRGASGGLGPDPYANNRQTSYFARMGVAARDLSQRRSPTQVKQGELRDC